MTRRLRKPVTLPVPTCNWSETEWAALAACTTADMNSRWAAAVEGDWLALVRSGQHCIFQATTARTEEGGRTVVELLCEGDTQVFNRNDDPEAVTSLFVSITTDLLSRLGNQG